jgi:serine/threonine protein kinase
MMSGAIPDVGHSGPPPLTAAAVHAPALANRTRGEVPTPFPARAVLLHTLHAVPHQSLRTRPPTPRHWLTTHPTPRQPTHAHPTPPHLAPTGPAPQISHRDLKPGNILLGCGYTVKLCDFGSAHSPLLCPGGGEGHDRSASTSASAGITAALEGMAGCGGQGGHVQPQAAASRWYCAPESLLGGAATPASDVWAFGRFAREGVR